MIKVIEFGNAWKCENMDNFAPICWEGYEVLFSDGSRKLTDTQPTAEEMATEEEKKAFYQSLGALFVGDVVEVVKGRTIPKGTRKTISRFFDYKISYNQHIQYVVFTDGSKINIDNIKGVLNTENNLSFKFERAFSVGGRK